MGIDAPFAQYVDTQRAVRVDHHLDDARIGQGGFDRRSHRRSQHRAAALGRQGGGCSAHWPPPASSPPSVRLPTAIWRPSWAMNRSNRSLPIASAALSASRSEEHTSELQSLMRISYAVFCL